MRTGLSPIVCPMGMRRFQKRRLAAARALPAKSLLVLPAAPALLRQPDVPHPYRQDSNFYYLTGFPAAGGLLALRRSGRSVFFLPGKDPAKELWDGPMLSPSEAKKKFLFSEAYPLSRLDQSLERIFRDCRKVFFPRGLNPYFDQRLRAFRRLFAPADEFLAPFRRIKDEWEAGCLRRAAAATAWGHREIALALMPGSSERALHGAFLKAIMERGAAREGYQSIIAAGGHAATLHYTQNSGICRKGELLLVDAGAEMDYYTADVSRVYPVSGAFSKIQKSLYSPLLRLQKRMIREVRPGASMKSLNKKMREGLGEILLEAGLLRPAALRSLARKARSKEKLLDGAAKIFCPHSLGHLLGLDVHDAGNKDDLILEAGMALTIEPGIYIPAGGMRQTQAALRKQSLPPSKKTPPAGNRQRGQAAAGAKKEAQARAALDSALNKILNKEALKPLLGTGLRIEDNILVTAKGGENLTKKIPKEPEDVEALLASRSAS